MPGRVKCLGLAIALAMVIEGSASAETFNSCSDLWNVVAPSVVNIYVDANGRLHISADTKIQGSELLELYMGGCPDHSEQIAAQIFAARQQEGGSDAFMQGLLGGLLGGMAGTVHRSAPAMTGVHPGVVSREFGSGACPQRVAYLDCMMKEGGNGLRSTAHGAGFGYNDIYQQYRSLGYSDAQIRQMWNGDMRPGHLQ